ncbi:hypothetical protein CYMTET_39112 [Cymbomonas tetramitiformis]|uniref:Uncharacterized protein n=1 Tax=Cymbomonas tetramitiformis TaxID=36881 RepID=A0AAE0CBV7_9CHLO|nr:hypothetical protein CYMTET_39112 [Cymbomonas tetramitiformis]
MDTWGYDVKQLNRLGELSEGVAKLVFQEHGFNLLRTPIRACYHPDWKARYPNNGHPYPGKVNRAAYEGEISDVVHAKAVKPDIKLFASLRLCVNEETGVFYPALPNWCLYNETDKQQGKWDGSKDTQVKAPMYAELLADFLTFSESAGIFYDFLGIENESGLIGNKTFVVHWVKAKDIVPTDLIGRSANHIDELENLLAVQANLYDHGFSGFVWWSYGTKTAEFAPTSTDIQRVAMHAVTESTLMRTPVLMDDHDGKNASQYSFTSRALRRGDNIVVWVTNNNDAAWEAYPFILASGNLQAPCGASDAGSSIRWDQFYLASTSTNTSGSQDPMWGNRSGVATVLGSNAFSVPIPKRTVTMITLDVTGVVDPAMRVARFQPHADVYALQKGDAGVLDEVYKLNAQTHGWGGVGLIKFHTEGLNGAVVNATLYVHVAEGSGIENIMVERVGNDWEGKSVKWSSLPARAQLPSHAADRKWKVKCKPENVDQAAHKVAAEAMSEVLLEECMNAVATGDLDDLDACVAFAESEADMRVRDGNKCFFYWLL